MALYDVKVVVTYLFEVEAENESEAETLGWDYKKYSHSAEVYSIDVTQNDAVHPDKRSRSEKMPPI